MSEEIIDENNVDPNEGKEVSKICTYTITVTKYTDGSQNMLRVNDGYHPLELLGLMDFTSREIVEQMNGNIKPDVIKRQVIVD